MTAGDMAYVSAVGPIDPETAQVRSADIRQQTTQCLENLGALLEALGSSFDKVVWASWALREPSEFDVFHEEWVRAFDGEAPIGQGTLMPLSHRRAGFRVSVGVIAATGTGDVGGIPIDVSTLIAARSTTSGPDEAIPLGSAEAEVETPSDDLGRAWGVDASETDSDVRPA